MYDVYVLDIRVGRPKAGKVVVHGCVLGCWVYTAPYAGPDVEDVAANIS